MAKDGYWFDMTMRDKNILKLVSYFNVDDGLVENLVKDYDDVDALRAHLTANIEPCSMGAMRPLEAYDPVVRAVVGEILCQAKQKGLLKGDKK